MPVGFSMMLVVHRQRISMGGRSGALTVKISSSPSRSDAAASLCSRSNHSACFFILILAIAQAIFNNAEDE